MSGRGKKYDALTQRTRADIARLEEPIRERLFEAKLAKLSGEAQAAHRTPPEKRNGGQQELVAQTARKVAISPQQIAQELSAADQALLTKLQVELKKYDSWKPAPLPVALGLQDGGPTAPKTYLLERGELSNRAAEVVPGYPIILLPDNEAVPARVQPPQPTTTGRRAALASWIADPNHPLTARVLVNRLWQHHFGRGIVPRPSDFGVRGEPPTHPELLDWLATEFVTQPQPGRGWSIKAMHKLMLMSATYRQSTQGTPETKTKDPDNQLFLRMNRLRLEGEIIRDSLLSISGRLNRQMGGPGVFPPIPSEALQGFKGWKTSPDPRDQVRRSVYIFARRNLRYPFLEAFDLPDSNLSCPRRERSTTAPQALALLNAAEVIEAARALAGRLTKEATSDEERVSLAYRLTLGRRPSPMELERSRAFLNESPLSELCRALFNVNEFVYLD